VNVLIVRAVLRAVRREVVPAPPERSATGDQIKAASVAIILALIATALGALAAFRNGDAWPAMALSLLFAGMSIIMALPVRRLGVGKCALIIAALGTVIWPLVSVVVSHARSLPAAIAQTTPPSHTTDPESGFGPVIERVIFHSFFSSLPPWWKADADEASLEPAAAPATKATTQDAERLHKQELDSLQGAWTLENIQTMSWPKPQGKGPDKSGHASEQQWIIKGNEITWINQSGREENRTFTIDPTQSPKQFNVKFVSGPFRGKNCQGIYERGDVSGKMLSICLTDPLLSTATSFRKASWTKAVA